MLRLPYILKSDVDWETYVERNDMFSVRGKWEWIDGNVYVYELSSGPHRICARAIEREIYLNDPEKTLISLGSSRKYLIFFFGHY